MSLLPGVDPRDPRVNEVFNFLEERGMVPGLGHLGVIASGAAVPSGWAVCDGRPLSCDAYRSLFLTIGTAYGGDGISTFHVPNLMASVPGPGCLYIIRIR